jgi:DNA polymerase I-like protein with 3'-5' exonuclease and polymerase domains
MAEVELLEQAVALHNPELLLICGETALQALTPYAKLDKWRGSFISTNTGHQALAMYEPLRLFHDHETKFLTTVDARKLALRHHAANPPTKDYTTNPTFDEAVETLLYLRDDCDLFSLDIETWRRHSLYCIGFSDGPNNATTIPFMSKHTPGYHYWTEDQERQLWLLLSEVMSNPNSVKVAQNALFDMSFLWDHGHIITQGRVWDTMVNHHLLYPDLKKGLDLLTSVYTLDPYYKEEGKSGISDKKGYDETEFFRYNCKDADTTLRCHHAIMAQLRGRNQMPVAQHTADLLMQVSFTLGLRGLPINRPRMAELALDMDAQVAALEKRVPLEHIAIEIASSAQMKAYLYGEAGLSKQALTMQAKGRLNPKLARLLPLSLGLPPQKKLAKKAGSKEKHQTVTADEKALVALKQILLNKKYAPGGKKDTEIKRQIAFLDLVLEYREKSKLTSTYFHCRLSPDGRMRTTLSLAGPFTGRFASKQYYDETGANQQNLTKVAKEYIVPIGAAQ